jgi:tetratricopeptide (TPR) repeat protein
MGQELPNRTLFLLPARFGYKMPASLENISGSGPLNKLPVSPDPAKTMTTAIIQNLEKMLASGKDSALLRFSLGNEYLKLQDAGKAAEHLRQAVTLDPNYSAAWKILGKALAEAGKPQEALDAYQQGIAVAEQKGDKQASKEMTVFAKRIEKQLAQKEDPT